MCREERLDRFSDEDDTPRDCAECRAPETPDSRLVWCGSELLCPSCAGVSIEGPTKRERDLYGSGV
jgi:hypothetical protein